MSTYSEGQFVVSRGDTSKYGEVLKVIGNGAYRVRYPIYNDPDRDYDITIEDYTTIRPITLHEYEDALHGSYLQRKRDWHIPCDHGTRVHNGDQKYYCLDAKAAEAWPPT